MKYSAGIISKSFWYLESKKTAQYMLEGLTRKEILKLALEENIYQVDSEHRAKSLTSAIYTRLNSLPEPILEAMVNSDITTSKILVLISIMKTDRLFFEFMHEVFRNNIILGDLTLKNRDFNIFFQEKKAQSEIVDNWVEETIRKLKSRYLTILNFAGLIKTESDKTEIIVHYVDFRVKQKLIDHDLGPYVYAVTGER